MKRIVSALAVGLMLSGCASTGRMLSYGNNNAQAQIDVGGRKMNVWSHPSEPSLLIVQTVGAAALGGAVEGATLGLAKARQPDPRLIDAAVAQFVAPVGCTAEPSQELGSGGIQFEARFSCPGDVNLRELMFAQKEDLMRGQPIRRQ